MNQKFARVELREDRDGELDDVVVQDVAMFRLERMGRNMWWAACYLDENAEEQVTFWFRWTRKDGLTVMAEDESGNEQKEPRA